LPDDLIGRTFLTDEDKDGQRFCATITRKILEHDAKTGKELTKFLETMDDEAIDQIRGYNQFLGIIENQYYNIDCETYWKFKSIVAHSGPLKLGDRFYKG
jgi:hypothetical protein